MNTKMKIVTNLISTPLGSILEKSNSIAKAMDNYNKFSTVKTSDTVIDNLNKNPYNVNFEFFIKAILDNIAKKKEEL